MGACTTTRDHPLVTVDTHVPKLLNYDATDGYANQGYCYGYDPTTWR
ncbi:hypothetical protein [Streptomyces sp. NPDC059928]